MQPMQQNAVECTSMVPSRHSQNMASGSARAADWSECHCYWSHELLSVQYADCAVFARHGVYFHVWIYATHSSWE